LLAITEVVTDPAAWGAFLTGLGSVIGACLSIRKVKRSSEENCDQRIKDIHDAFEEGTRFEERRSATG